MSVNKQEFAKYVKEFSFRELFNDLGWNNDKTNQTIQVDSLIFNLQGIAEKSGFKILLCNPANNSIPDYDIRKKIDTQITKLFQEHLIIYIDGQKKEQIWQLVVRQSGKPIKVTETRYNSSQDPELLYQRTSGIFFELNEEDKITIVDVTSRVTENFQQNNERVTKKFYDEFRNEHESFLSFIKGIDSTINREWYSSLMLNRLMFCYFIQKKGFLDSNKNYLRDKLKICQERKGKDKFYSFYRDFLLILFHQGLNEPSQKKETIIELGKIPYLNGGMFDEHELEKEYKDIEIEDVAFEKIFDFFDEYNWHLDTRITATGKDINPDVIGYIFEKYINDRSQMGAYYTKEDITDYISKNSVLPFLFDESKRIYPTYFENTGELWKILRESSDKYIYESIKHGVNEILPTEITKGINDINERTNWNNYAPEAYALTNETWREVIDRRNQYSQIKNNIESGEIKSISILITYNLDIRQFAQDVVENTSDPEFLKTFYQILNNVTILDPTCGSGAFLFAAMNILEPLYEACLQRMDNFVSEFTGEQNKFFENTLNQVKSLDHPNLQYFIFKSIILRNLYGVDIMKEAVEIAKLRLFLKLVACLEVDSSKPNFGLEPLPDIDFNIRSGNTLIGYASEEDLKKSLTGMFDFDDDLGKMEKKFNTIANMFSSYKEIQLDNDNNFNEYKNMKEELYEKLKELNSELNQLLFKLTSEIKYEKWVTTYQPFHWFAEFYEIIHDKGGFDVVIGNPPYVEYTKVRNTYKIKGFETEKCGNLYGFVIERCVQILNKNGLMGMIIPISAFSNSSMETLQNLFKKFPLVYISNFHQRPAALFEGVLQRLSIFILYKDNIIKGTYSTKVYRWKSESRKFLFKSIFYIQSDQTHQSNFLKLGSPIENSILNKYLVNKTIIHYIAGSNDISNKIYYRTAGGGYWVTFLNTSFDTTSLSNKGASFQKQYSSKVMSAVLNSNLFWWYYSINFDQFNFKDYMIFGFRFNYPENKIMEQKLIKLSDKLEEELLTNASTYVINSKTRGRNETITYNKYLSKTTMDEIDKVLADLYGFNAEELDFITNYDYKYRMSKDDDEKIES